MGSFEGAEVCELVGLYIRSVLSRKYGKSQIGLYQDDGLAAFRSNSQTSDRIRKEITNCFKDQGLNITIQANLEEVNFLDVTFNLPTDQFLQTLQETSRQPYLHPHKIQPSLNSIQKTSASESATYPPGTKFSLNRHRTSTTR